MPSEGLDIFAFTQRATEKARLLRENPSDRQTLNLVGPGPRRLRYTTAPLNAFIADGYHRRGNAWKLSFRTIQPAQD
jgi:hypothetical protein